MAKFLEASGAQTELPLDISMYKESAKAGMTLPQYLNHKYPTGAVNAEKYGNTFDQLCASEGIVLKTDRKLGLKASTMAEASGFEAAATTKDGVPASRILFPAVFFQAVENQLQPDFNMTANAFEKMIGYDEAISGDRYEQPVLDYSAPQGARSQTISQLAMPASMMLITAADKPYKIPTFGLGLEISDQAQRAFTLDFVSMSVARQIAAQRMDRAQQYILALLNGDIDNGETSLATYFASISQTILASVLDSASTGGALTQKAWIKWLMRNGTKRRINMVVTDVNGALSIENRTGRPVITNDNPTSKRMDTIMQVANPTWSDSVSVFITDDPTWPANTIMGLDTRYAVRRVRNLLADYSAIEQYVIQRKTSMRFDFGEHVNRMFIDAFDLLTLA